MALLVIEELTRAVLLRGVELSAARAQMESEMLERWEEDRGKLEAAFAGEKKGMTAQWEDERHVLLQRLAAVQPKDEDDTG
eukprot:2150319-Rhodomonas_salina.1